MISAPLDADSPKDVDNPGLICRSAVIHRFDKNITNHRGFTGVSTF